MNKQLGSAMRVASRWAAEKSDWLPKPPKHSLESMAGKLGGKYEGTEDWNWSYSFGSKDKAGEFAAQAKEIGYGVKDSGSKVLVRISID